MDHELDDEQPACLVAGWNVACWSNAMKRWNTVLFLRVGDLVARFPITAMVFGTLVVLAAATGLAGFEVHADDDFTESTPHTTAAWRDRGRFVEYFGQNTNQALLVTDVIVEFEKDSAGTAFSLPTLQALFTMHQRILSYTTAAGESFTDVCQRSAPGFPCNPGTIFDVAGITSADQLNSTAAAEAVATAVLSSPLLSTLVSGGVELNGTLVAADGMDFIYASSDLLTEKGRVDDWLEGVVPTLRSIYEESTAANTGYRLYPQNVVIFDEDTNELVARQFPLLGISVLIILAYLAVVLGHKPFFKNSRLLLSLNLVLTVVMSLLAGMGLTVYFGVGISPITPLIAFALLGIGVDDMIIITDSVEQVVARHPRWSVEKQVAHGVSQSGYAITITTLTTFMAFMCSAILDFPITRWFAYTGAISVLLIFFLQLTVFLGALTLDQRRMRSHRYDCCPCFSYTVDDDDEADAAAQRPKLEHHSSGLSSSSPTGPGAASLHLPGEHPLPAMEKEDEGLLQRVLVRGLAPALATRTWQVALILVFLAVAGASVYGVTQISSDFDIFEVYPSDMLINLNNRARTRLFPGQLYTITFGVIGADLSTSSVQSALDGLAAAVTADAAVIPPIRNWLQELRLFATDAGVTLNATSFDSTLSSFLANTTYITSIGIPASAFVQDLDIVNGAVRASRIVATTFIDTQTSVRSSIVNRLRSLVSPFQAVLGDTLVYANIFLLSDRDDELPLLLLESILITILGVSCILFLFVNPILVLLLAFSIALIDVDTFGLLALWGQSIDISVFLTATMAIGLSVDYMVHISHFYVEKFNLLPVEDNLRRTFASMGVPVLNGGLSTFLGVCVLGFSPTPAFLTFFRVLFGVVLFGILHGVFFTPAVLAMVSSDPKPGAGKSKEAVSLGVL